MITTVFTKGQLVLIEGNVLNEPTKARPDARAVAWLRQNELSNRTDLAVQVVFDALAIAVGPTPVWCIRVIVCVLRLWRPQGKSGLERFAQLGRIQQASIAQELQVLSVFGAKALQLGGGQVMYFKLPQAQHFPVAWDCRTAAAEPVRQRRQSLRNRVQVEAQGPRQDRAFAKHLDGLLLEV